VTAPSPDVSALPEVLAEPVARAWERYAEQAGEAVVADPRVLGELPRVLACSEWVAQSCVARPTLLADLAHGGDLFRDYGPEEYRERVAEALAEVADEEALMRALRRLRRREMVRIAWRDIAGRADLRATVADLSRLAEACIDGALTSLHRWQCEQLGTPVTAEGEPQGLVVIAMGKLGGGELNFSSDVDLMFAFPEEGETRGGRRVLANSQFFLRLGQRLINALDQVTADGFVFRVDMRLRPYGQSGPLAMSFDAMENYYQSQGREWERYAMVKARVVAGDRGRGAELMAALRPFVYRRYLDFGAFESLREMKAMIRQEVRRKGLEDNIKLGAGGIREVEFIAQAFQIIRGGNDPELTRHGLLEVLPVLAGRGLIPEFAAGELLEAYVFLRNTEHRLQEHEDRQTQVLPADPTARARLAYAMDLPDWEALAELLGHHRQRVADVFEQVFAAPQTDAHGDAGHSELAALWEGLMEDGPAHALLERIGFDDHDAAMRLLHRLREAHAVRAMSSSGRTRLDRLMPLLIGAAAASERPAVTLGRLVDLVEAIGRRTAYLALLVENPMALSQLVRLCAASPWIAAQLARHPLLLDELIDPRTLYAPPHKEGLARALAEALARVPEEDLEAQMEALRHFQQANQLRVAAADVVGALPLMVVSDHLTDLAEVCLEATLEVSFSYLGARHGEPRCRIGEAACGRGFAVIGYGKLGGFELGYGSDLDIVFLHAGRDGEATDGDRPVDVNVFFARLAQRIIHILTAHTPAGRLYEADLRLRPSGASGLPAVGLAAFEAYQEAKAWTWEHQALVRARFVAGDPAVGEAFAAIRRRILARPRDPVRLRGQVREMREKMRAQLGSGGAGVFDLKQDPGGIADIEFIVQYGVLRHAAEHPALLRWTDNIRLLQTFVDEGLMDADDGAHLAEAYRVLRAEGHRLTLEGGSTRVEGDAFGRLREGVLKAWRAWLEEG
jgi:glutamate-ammonia-ligase adenylyltransferase